MDLHTLTESSFATDDDVRALLSAFNDGTLPPSAWNHRAHMTAALSFGRTLPPAAALDAMRAGILRFNDAAGIVSTPDSGYHETITRFYMRAVTLHVQRGRGGIGERGDPHCHVTATLTPPVAPRRVSPTRLTWRVSDEPPVSSVDQRGATWPATRSETRALRVRIRRPHAVRSAPARCTA